MECTFKLSNFRSIGFLFCFQSRKTVYVNKRLYIEKKKKMLELEFDLKRTLSKYKNVR